MWVLKLVSCFRVTRAEACKLCVRLHIVVAVADAAVVAVAAVGVAWHECLMRDGSDRQLLPAIGTNAGRTGQTKTRTKSETKQTNKKRKNTICVVWMWILFVLFFSQVYFCCFLLRAWDLHARARTRHLCSRPLHCESPLKSPAPAVYLPFALPVYVILFMLPAQRKLRHF